MVYALIAIIALSILIGLVYRYYVKRTILKINYSYNLGMRVLTEKTEALKELTYNRMLGGELYKALSAMDKVHDSYDNEDEANRELTACLNVMGHTAIYHYGLDNGRTTDIFVDNVAIIEGKLDPNPTDIDRLIGQVDDYANYNYKIYIILYGFVDKPLINRINSQIVARYHDQVSLIYIDNPKRLRKIILDREFVRKN